MFEKENDYFMQHKNELREKYLGKFIVLKDDELKGVYETIEQAWDESKKTMEPGSFSIKEVTEEDPQPIYITRAFVYA